MRGGGGQGAEPAAAGGRGGGVGPLGVGACAFPSTWGRGGLNLALFLIP